MHLNRFLLLVHLNDESQQHLEKIETNIFAVDLLNGLESIIRDRDCESVGAKTKLNAVRVKSHLEIGKDYLKCVDDLQAEIPSFMQNFDHVFLKKKVKIL